MPDEPMPIERISVHELRAEVADVMNRVHYAHERVIICRHGKDFVAIVPVSDLAYLLEE